MVCSIQAHVAEKNFQDKLKHKAMAWINGNNEYYNGRSIVYNGQLIINPTDEMLTDAGYHEVVPPTPTEAELLANAKADKLYEIDAYDRSDAVNTFYLSGQPMWLDAQTRQTLRISIESHKAMGIENVTKWFGGQQFTFPVSAWLMMLNALEVYAADALNVTESHKAAVNSLETVAEVEAYDITAGYPTQLNLTQQMLTQQN